MKNKRLLKTNLLVSAILIVGFMLTAIFGYRANYQSSLDNIEQVSSLTTEGIYYQLSAMFTRPVNVSLTMAHDSLLVEHLAIEEAHLEDEQYERLTQEYLNAYREKYGFDSVFLVSAVTSRYYNFNGMDRILERGDPENVWYYQLLDSDQEYSLNVDNDEVEGAENEITVFVNCKIPDREGRTIGIVGVGIRIDYLKELLKSYEDKFNVNASLVGMDGAIEISTTYTGYERKDWFRLHGQEGIREQVMSWNEASSNLELWSASEEAGNESYVVSRYIPELSWYLIVMQDTGHLIDGIRRQMYRTAAMIIVVVLTVLIVITSVIRNFNRQITNLIEERQAMFMKATEEMYDNIYELNITKNCYVGERTRKYFEELGAKGLPYDQVLRVIAEKQIKEEFREGYVSTFSPEHVMEEYEMGNNHLQYDFMITQDGKNYYWMRIDTYIFYSAEDDSIHMFTYRRNIDADRRKELKADIDEMTGFYSKKATERIIEQMLKSSPGRTFAFFIFDIDNFKLSNDLFGHDFGDYCIKEFTDNIRRHFREGDIMGRIGGDEFVVFISIAGEEAVVEKVKELSKALDLVCRYRDGTWRMTASIGVAVSPDAGSDFGTLYRNADTALYRSKQRGKNGYCLYKKEDGIRDGD